MHSKYSKMVLPPPPLPPVLGSGSTEVWQKAVHTRTPGWHPFHALFAPSFPSLDVPTKADNIWLLDVKGSESRFVVSNSLQPHRLYNPWNSPCQNTGVGSLSLLQGIFPTQGWKPGLSHCRWILYQLSHGESPRILEWVAYLFSRGSSQPRNRTGVSCIAGRFFANWAIREAHNYWTIEANKITWWHQLQWELVPFAMPAPSSSLLSPPVWPRGSALSLGVPWDCLARDASGLWLTVQKRLRLRARLAAPQGWAAAYSILPCSAQAWRGSVPCERLSAEKTGPKSEPSFPLPTSRGTK